MHRNIAREISHKLQNNEILTQIHQKSMNLFFIHFLLLYWYKLRLVTSVVDTINGTIRLICLWRLFF